MQEFQSPKTEQFLTLVGGSLTDSIAKQQTLSQRQAVQELGCFIQAARTFHGISATALARQLELAETDFCALERGLLPYARITGPLLKKIAATCYEEEDVLVALFWSVQRQKNSLEQKQEPQLQHTPSVDQVTITQTALRDRLLESGQVQVEKYQQVLYKVCSNLFDRYAPSKLNRTIGMVAIASICCLMILRLGVLSDTLFFPMTAPVEWAGTVALHLPIPESQADLSTSIDAAFADQGLTGNHSEQNHTTIAPYDYTAPYHIIYTKDVMSIDLLSTTHASPLIPVSEDRMALIQIHDRVPRIVQRCQTSGYLKSCPM